MLNFQNLHRDFETKQYLKLNKYDSSNKNAHADDRRKILQSYITDISSIPVIRSSKKFGQFLNLNDSYTELNHTSLPQGSMEEIFEQFASKNSKKPNDVEELSSLNEILNYSNEYSTNDRENKINSNAYESFMQIKAMKNNEISKSQQRSKQKRDKLTLIDSFNDPSEIATKMYSKQNYSKKFQNVLLSSKNKLKSNKYRENINPLDKPETDCIYNYMSTKNYQNKKCL